MRISSDLTDIKIIMKENLYGVIIEPPSEPKDVLRLLQDLDKAQVDYIMPKPGTVAVLGSDLLKIYELVQRSTQGRVIRWSGDLDPRLGWRTSSVSPYNETRQTSTENNGPCLKFTYDDYPLFIVDSSGIYTGYPAHIYWKAVLNIIHRYGFKDEDIKADDPIWRMADQSG